MIEALIGLTLVALGTLGLASMGRAIFQRQAQSNLTFAADQTRRNLMGYLNSSRSWNQTISATQNNRAHGSALDCLVPPLSPCTTNGTDLSAGGTAISNYPIHAVLDASGNVVYDSTSTTAGFTANGTPCNEYSASGNDACPLRFDIKWSAVCTGSCVNPQVRLSVVPTYSPSTAARRLAFNSANYSSNALQGMTGRALTLIAVMGVPMLPAVFMNSTSPYGWTPIPATCTHGGTYCNAADAKTYMQLGFDSEGPTDLFMLNATVRICITSAPSTTCQPATPPAGQGHGLAFFILDSSNATVFYQDFAMNAESMVMNSGAVYVNGLTAGHYTAQLGEFETQTGNYVTFSGGRQLAIYKLQ